jgi:hypothetical protein
VERYDGVEFGPNVDELVIKQLKTGMYRSCHDSGPSDWLIRAWRNLSPNGQRRLSEAVHGALLNHSVEVRLGALRTLDICSSMIIPNKLLDIAINHLELFRDVHRSGDPPNFDRGRDLVRLASAVARGPKADAFRRKLVMEPNYGNSVLVSLARQEPNWVLKHLSEIVNSQIDPAGKRVHLLVSGLKWFPKQLRRAVTLLTKREPGFSSHLKRAIKREISDPNLQAMLLSITEMDHH